MNLKLLPKSFLFLLLFFTTQLNKSFAQSKNYGDRTETAIFIEKEEKSTFEETKPEEEETPLEEIFMLRDGIDINESVFDSSKKKKKLKEEYLKNNPPVPIDDYLEFLALGGILLFAFVFKKHLFK